MVASVFATMYYKVGIGYLYGYTYYYSIMDILLSQNLYVSRGLYLTVNMMSSFSKNINNTVVFRRTLLYNWNEWN